MMTEAEWLVCTDPQPMLRHLLRDAHEPAMIDERKRDLLGCAWWREIKPHGPFSEALVREIEESGVGRLANDSMADACWLLWECRKTAEQTHTDAAVALRLVGASIIRDLVGSPWRRQATIRDRITPTVLSLAHGAHDHPAHGATLDPVRLAILSDALEEAGCADEVILSHLRSPGPHWRGCWAVDLIMGVG